MLDLSLQLAVQNPQTFGHEENIGSPAGFVWEAFCCPLRDGGGAMLALPV